MVQVQVRRVTAATPVRRRLTGRALALVDSRHTVTVAAVAAVLLRLPGLTRPIRADEAGFTLVARAWDPGPHSLYGPYFVDRPPLLIAVFRASDALGGPLFIRVLGAVTCGVLVLVSAGLARDLGGSRAARWTAIAVASITGNIFIDAVAVKGELLALPVLVGSCWLSVRAVRAGPLRTTVLLAASAGVLASVAVGLKQNLVGGFVFGVVLVVGARLAGRIPTSRLLAILVAAGAGAAVPVLVTVGWAAGAGVPLHTLWYDVFGFRSDAAEQIAHSEPTQVLRRAGMLVASALLSGLLVVLVVWGTSLRGQWRRDRVLVCAVLALLAVDTAGLIAGGSFWRDYLFPLVPSTVLCAALVAGRDGRAGRWMRGAISFAAVSTALALVGWVGYNAAGLQEYDETDTGHALAAVRSPGDTMVVFGGRADLQITSGMSSPYEHLWSLPMRTLDPDLTELDAVVSGPRAPTWIVEWVNFGTWNGIAGVRLGALVASRYELHGTGCGDHPIWLLRGVTRPLPTPHCH